MALLDHHGCLNLSVVKDFVGFDGPCITILGHFPPRPNAIGYWQRQDKSLGRGGRASRNGLSSLRKMCLHSIDDDNDEGRHRWTEPHTKPQFPVSQVPTPSGVWTIFTCVSPKTGVSRPRLWIVMMWNLKTSFSIDTALVDKTWRVDGGQRYPKASYFLEAAL